MKNKYLGGGSGGDVLGKLIGLGKASDDNAFKTGSGRMLETDDGDGFSLGGSVTDLPKAHK